MDETIKFEQRENEFLEQLARETGKHHFPIAIYKNNNFQVRATCVAITTGKENFLITASHVTHLREEAGDRSIYIFNLVSNEFIRITEDIVDHAGTDTPAHGFDAAIIKLEMENYKNIPRENFLHIDRIYIGGPTLRNMPYFFMGYPASQNKPFPKYKSTPKCLFFLTREEPSSRVSRVSDLFTVDVVYDNPARPDPAGLSGGGLWTSIGKSPEGPVLAGILIASRPGTQHLICLKIEIIVAMISGFFPGTALDHVYTSIKIQQTASGARLFVARSRLSDNRYRTDDGQANT